MSNDKPLDAVPGDSRGHWFGAAESMHAALSDTSERMARVDVQLCELQAHMDDLIEANLRLRSELSEMTLRWVMDKSDHQ